MAEPSTLRLAAELRQVLARHERDLACRRQESVAYASSRTAWQDLREAGYIDGLTRGTLGLTGEISAVLARWGL